MAEEVKKKEADGQHPASHYLVVGDPQKPTTWHLRIKNVDGEYDHRLMGNAHAALLSPEGFRGRPYEGPNKEEAIAKLKALYKSEKMTWPGEAKSEAKEGNESASGRTPNLIESARLLEVVEGSEGLEWEIECITAGRSANRKDYSEEVLKSALPLFEGLVSYANHPSKQEMQEGLGRDITKMAGWVSNARWDPSGGKDHRGAVVGIYHALKNGPIAGLIKEAWERNKPDLVQFSILGEGRQKVSRDPGGRLYYHVEAIDDLFSLDAVPEGAAGGRVRALIASEQKEVEKLDKVIEELTKEELMELRPDLFEAKQVPVEKEERTVIAEAEEVETKPEEKKAAVEPTKAETESLEAIREEVVTDVNALKEEMRKLVAQNRRSFLDRVIGDAALPPQIKAQIRKRYEGTPFVESDVEADVAENVKIWSEVMREAPKVHLTITESKPDKLLDAVEGMLAGKDVNDVPRFHSIKEAFCKVTGQDFHMSRQQFADSVISESVNYASWMRPNLREATLREAISWTSVLGVSMYRRLIAEYRAPIYDEWKLIVSEISELDNTKQQLRERTGYYGTLPTVAAGGTYQPLTSPGEEEANFTPAKRGGLESWNWEDALNDDLGALKKIPKKLALAAKITLYQFIFNFLRDGATTATTYDATNLFAAGHGNAGTNALGTAGVSAAVLAMRSQTALSSTATFLAIRPKYLVVPNELEALAGHLYDSKNYVPATIDGANNVVVNNPHYQKYQPIVVDYWTNATRWFMVADPNLAPTIEVGFLGGNEEPELFSLAENTGSAFTADKVVWKIRHVYGAGVLDHRGLYTSTP